MNEIVVYAFGALISGVQVLGMFILSGLRADVKEGARALNDLRELLAREYVTRTEMETRHKETTERLDEEIKVVRQRMHELGNRVSEVIALGRWIEENKK